MLDLDTASRLKDVGLPWDPQPGDRFIVPVPDLTQEVFILSNVIADVHDFEGGEVIGFNGTTEWALDSVEKGDVVWLPREEQLRAMLGAAFVSLEQVAGGWAVTATAAGVDHRYVDADAECAYAAAVLARLTTSTTTA